MDTIREEARSVPVADDVDLCVIGGSCTGVFAAVRAARLGLKVAIVENNGFFGGVATAGLVCIWHTTFDTVFKRQIIGGMTTETLDRLRKRNAVRDLQPPNAHAHYYLNTEELKIELDELVREAGVRPFLHARFTAAPSVVQTSSSAQEPSKPAESRRVTAAIIEDKTGRRAIRAKFFIDASGDGDLLVRAGFACHKPAHLQPSTACAVLHGLEQVATRNPDFKLGRVVFDQQYPEALKKGFLWSARQVAGQDLTMVAGTRAFGLDCSDGDQLTQAEMECRSQIRSICDLLRRRIKGGEGVSLVDLASYIGIRQTRQVEALHRLTEQEVLDGVRFDDAIANGSYRVDVHHADRPGITFRYLDGTEEVIAENGQTTKGRWRPVRTENPTFYQIPYRALIPRGAANVLAAGRLMDADENAYGAVRVMVDCNQTGEAAGVAACVALNQNVNAAEVDTVELRRWLAEGGSIVI